MQPGDGFVPSEPACVLLPSSSCCSSPDVLFQGAGNDIPHRMAPERRSTRPPG